jgi:hypothetical protein
MAFRGPLFHVHFNGVYWAVERQLSSLFSDHLKKTKLNSVAWVRERTIPTERPPLVCEASANFAGRGSFKTIIARNSANIKTSGFLVGPPTNLKTVGPVFYQTHFKLQLWLVELEHRRNLKKYLWRIKLSILTFKVSPSPCFLRRKCTFRKWNKTDNCKEGNSSAVASQSKQKNNCSRDSSVRFHDWTVECKPQHHILL